MEAGREKKAVAKRGRAKRRGEKERGVRGNGEMGEIETMEERWKWKDFLLRCKL